MSENGETLKAFNVKDGLAIELLRLHDIKAGVISGKSSGALTKRCEEIGFDVVERGCKYKLSKFNEICVSFDVSLEEVAFCGDDVIDLPIMENYGLSVVPCDAHDLALQHPDWTSEFKKGSGMFRDFVDLLSQEQSGLSLYEIYNPLLNKVNNSNLIGVE